ncbi:exonuclease domain-containing protein [Spongiivirga citrea]|uniref:GIY-YIG nuclease family protein n=1 Tax=Spongiivirga citrea TaxID=1481457 RepID=A0A6M0CLI1_9FLAO|nr:exonuclease domain-containing protein [Spongiivirga citrea]NER16709.1 GIY-YIG nuclease family protein [Spongiivirga citrea]
MYCIVDIETTGNTLKGNKITEIAMFKHDGHKIVDEYTTLVNPKCDISSFITSLTGIDNNLVAKAPTFEEIAENVIEFSKDCIFVAHSVHFDYNVIKYELERLNIDFQRKKLCTVRLSRKLIPGYKSYSLGKLCTALDIPLSDRHRARGDAHATVLLFEKLINQPDADEVFASSVKGNSREATLPPLLPKSTLTKIPNSPGIYYFKNAEGTIIYVGKAKKLKNRVLQHFYDRSDKEVRMCREIAHIDFELAGSELLALLMESAEIKQRFPKYNSSQKHNAMRYGLFEYENRNGVKHLAFNNIKKVVNPIMAYSTISQCRTQLQEICHQFQLCPRYCQLQENKGCGTHFFLNNCTGVCEGNEQAEDYNERVSNAISHLKAENQSYIIKEKGRNEQEQAFVCVEDGKYIGYGFVDQTTTIVSSFELTPFMTRQKDNEDVQRILRSYISKNPRNLISLTT